MPAGARRCRQGRPARCRCGWLTASIALYIVTGLFWLPVVWIQIKIKQLALAATRDGLALPASYDKLFRIWFACGLPAFAAVLTILWLMLARPHFRLW